MEYETLVIRVDGGLGRVIAMSGAVTEVAKTRPVKVVTSRPLVFRGNTIIKSVHGLDDRRLFEDVIKGNDYIEIEPYTKPAFFNDAVNWLEIVKEELGLEEVAEPCLFLAEHEKSSNVLEGNNPVLYQPFGSTMEGNGSDKSYRSLPIYQAQYLANQMIKEGYTPYLVIKPGQPVLDGCKILDTPNLRWVVSLCARYPVVGCDSCLHHAAKAFNRTAIVLWAGTDSQRYGYKSNINMREYPMVAHTPLRLGMNDFNFDISNQHTNDFSIEFLEKVLDSLKVIAG